MINNQWYAVLSSHELKKGRVIAARRFGEDLVFYRTENGEPACAEHLCAHRKASLAKGWVEGDHIKCPFHGIEYDINGKCVHVPSEGRASAADFSRLRLKTYPVREIGGIIFIWYGDGAPDKEPDYFDVINDPRFNYDHMDDCWSVDYSRVIENQLDVSHLAFVHHNTIGRGNKTLCNGPKVVWLDDNTLQTSADNEKDAGQSPKASDESAIKNTNLTFKFPNMWLNHISDKIMVLAYFVPVDDGHSIISLRFYNRITGIKAIDKMIAWFGSRANKIIERQDKRIVETQIPKKTGLAIGENLVAADLPIIEYRTSRNAMQKAGGKQGSANADVAAKTNVSGAAADKRVFEYDPKAMRKLTYGLFICTAVQGGKANGCIINTAIQAASDPNRISISINKTNYTHDMVKDSGLCNISVISKDADFELFKRFGFQSGRDVDKFADYPASNYHTAGNGIPFITDGTNAYFSLKVVSHTDLGSHTEFICEPTFMTVLSDADSCSYEYYQNEIKPKPQPVGKTANGQTIWRCIVCGFEWIGDELPDDFICPICKHGKEDFERVV